MINLNSFYDPEALSDFEGVIEDTTISFEQWSSTMRDRHNLYDATDTLVPQVGDYLRPYVKAWMDSPVAKIGGVTIKANSFKLAEDGLSEFREQLKDGKQFIMYMPIFTFARPQFNAEHEYVGMSEAFWIIRGAFLDNVEA